MENGVCVKSAVSARISYAVKKEESEGQGVEKPRSFKEQIMEAALQKSPREMTLLEYRQYIQQKIEKMFPLLPKLSLVLVVNISDMALVHMKSDPDCEKMVLESLRDQMSARKDADAVQLEFYVRHARDRKQERKKQHEFLLMKKKKMEIYYEKRALRREAYTEFLETGRRYATPCPATEVFAAAQAMGGNLFFGF